MPPSPPEASSFLATLLVQKCTSITTLRKARQTHALILTSTSSVSQSPFLNNNLLSMYARCGSLIDSRKVFDKMPQRNIVSYNALIAAYSRSPCQAMSAFELLTQMVNECIRLNGSTFTSLIQSSSLLEDWLIGSQLHTQVIKFGFSDDVQVQTSLLGMYSNCGDLEFAKKVFTHIVDKDVVAWNSIICGYMRNNKIMEGLYLFGSMIRSGNVPTHFTYSMVFNACSKLGDYDVGRITHGQVILSGTPIDLPLQNSLLDMYCNCRDIQTAFCVFSRIENPDLVSWNSIISGFSNNGDGEKAMDVFVHLCRRSYDGPDEYTFAAVISATGVFPASDYGKPIHARIKKGGFQKSLYVGSTLVSMYFNNGETESAQKIFSSILVKDDVLWTDMIAGHARMGDGENSIKFFHGMYREGHRIDGFSLSSTLSACADLATQKQGEVIHCLAVKTGNEVEISVCGSLVDMYAKTGDLQAAESILSGVRFPDLKCWNSMLGGYGHHGKAKEALKVFDEILRNNLRPDKVTFISMLTACSHCGLIDEGKFLWNYMKESGLFPGPKHYSCMVTLLSRAGLLEEAEGMIIESPFSEDYLDLWRTLLSSCVKNRNLRIGVRVAEQVLSIDREDSATHILLTNLYASTGQWDGVTEMRKKMRGLMLEKDPGLSWIEVMNDVHVFSSNDQSHPKLEEMQAELSRLQRNMRRTEIIEI